VKEEAGRRSEAVLCEFRSSAFRLSSVLAMTEAQARTTANVVLAAAAIGAAYYVLKTPVLRRRVWLMARSWAAGPLVAWTAMEIRRAWDMSGSAAARGGSSTVSAAGAGRLPIDGTRSGLSEPRPRRNQGDKMTM
jgi:hypothetical protein